MVRHRVLVSAFPGSNPGASDNFKFQESPGINRISSIILAGGKGERMKSPLPKVLQPLKNKPLIHYVVEALKDAGVTDIVTVIGYRGELVKEALADGVRYAWQHEQLGTGHAVMQAEDSLADFKGNVVIACGDVPLISSETIKSMIDLMDDEKSKAVVLTMDVDDPSGYGRIVKDSDGNFLKIVEEKDADTETRSITEVNTGTYVFDKDFLFAGLKKIDRNNAQGEYYLPDALMHVLDTGFSVKTLLLEDSVEGTGINTRDELQQLEQELIRRQK